MKKALLTILIVLMSVAYVFASFNYGIDVSGVYKTTLTDDKTQELTMSFKPYVSGEKYKVQLKADWDPTEGFKPVKKCDIDNYFDFAEKVFEVVDNAHFDFNANSGFGIATYEVTHKKIVEGEFVSITEKLPFFFIKASDSIIDFQFKSGERTLAEDLYQLPVFIDFSVVLSDKFPIKLKTGIVYDLYSNGDADEMLHDVSAKVGLDIPVVINGHKFSIAVNYGTPFTASYSEKDYEIEKDAFEDWILGAAIETNIKNLKLNVNAEIDKKVDKSGVLTLGADAEYELGSLKAAVGGSIPYVMRDNWKINTVSGVSKDKLYATVSYGTKYSVGATLKINGLAKAIDDNLKYEDFVEPAKKYVSFTAFVGLDTKPFDIKISTELMNVKKFNCDVKMAFTVNTENFLSK